MKGALTSWLRMSETKLWSISNADIQRSEADDAVLDFSRFWERCGGDCRP